MPELEDKLSAILGNPELMGQIMSMVQTLNQQGSPSPEPPQQKQKPPQSKPPQQRNPSPIGRNELEMIQKISALSQQTSLDRQEHALIKALAPYLSGDRLSKLEKAMHAAKMANFASLALSQSGGHNKLGR